MKQYRIKNGIDELLFDDVNSMLSTVEHAIETVESAEEADDLRSVRQALLKALANYADDYCDDGGGQMGCRCPNTECNMPVTKKHREGNFVDYCINCGEISQ